MNRTDEYLDFLRAKAQLAPATGFEVDPAEVNPALKPHTRDIVRWILKGGRRAVFASFGCTKRGGLRPVSRPWHRGRAGDQAGAPRPRLGIERGLLQGSGALPAGGGARGADAQPV